MNNRFNLNDSGNNNVFEKLDFRQGIYDQLKLEKYSPIGQVRAMLAIEGLNLILNQQKNWMKEKVFIVNKDTHRVLINQSCSKNILKSKLESISKLKEFSLKKLLVANDIAPFETGHV